MIVGGRAFHVKADLDSKSPFGRVAGKGAAPTNAKVEYGEVKDTSPFFKGVYHVPFITNTKAIKKGDAITLGAGEPAMKKLRT